MKRFWASLTMAGLIGAAGFGCANTEAQQEKELFYATVDQVDMGGSYLCYTDMHQFGGEVDKMCEIVVKALSSGDESSEEIQKTINLFLKALNLKAIQGVASSSRSVDGVVVNKNYTLFDTAAPKGLLFAMTPWENRPFTMRSMILPNARLALGGYLQPAKLWLEFAETMRGSDVAELKDLPSQADAAVLAGTGVPLDDLLATLNGEYFLMVTEDTPENGVPDYQAVLALPDRNGVLRQLIEKKLGAFLQKSADGYKVPAMMVPMLGLSPEIIFEEGRVVLVSSRKIWEAAKAGGNLENHPELGVYFRDMPAEGQGFAYVNISRSLVDAVGAALENEEMVNAIFADLKLPVAYGVSHNVGNGSLGVCRSNYSIDELQTALPMAVYAGMLLPALNQAREETREKTREIGCMNNLKQLGLGLMMYANDNGNQYPTEPGIAGLTKVMAGEYLPDASVFVCPSSCEESAGEKLDDASCSYLYLGNLIATPQAPVALEKPGHHEDGKCNVLFADGHVETLDIDSDDPVEVVEYLAERDEWKPEMKQQLLNTLKQLGYEAEEVVAEEETEE